MFKRVLHTLSPKMCTSNYRWKNDWLICDKCGQKIGFKYFIPDYDLTYDVEAETIVCKDKELEQKMFYVYPFSNLIDKESVNI